jgi:TRAP-type C4-dicarboxylate transport system substrate-binding protein
MTACRGSGAIRARTSFRSRGPDHRIRSRRGARRSRPGIVLGVLLQIRAARRHRVRQRSGIAGPASAQTKLKWAHVYEIAEPYHTEALWAADEIKKRTNGKLRDRVFPASQLGNENQINEGLGLGTVDIIYTGVAFAGSIHKPLAITGAPFMLRDFDHWKAYRDSKLFRDIAKGYEDKTKHKVDRADLLRPAHGHRQQGNQEARGHEGHEAARAAGAAVLMFTKSVGANATPIAFAEVYLALQQGTVDGQENPLPTIMAKKFYEVQSTSC